MWCLVVISAGALIREHQYVVGFLGIVIYQKKPKPECDFMISNKPLLKQ